MDDIKQGQRANLSEDAIGSDNQNDAVNILGEMPSYNEFRAQITDKDATGGTAVSSTFLEFEKAHPELAQEMRENNVPLNEADFKAQGYEFYRDYETDTPHVKVQTEAYKDWQEVHKNEPPLWLKRFEAARAQKQMAKPKEQASEPESLKEAVKSWTSREQIKDICVDLFPDREFYGYKMRQMVEEIPRLTSRNLEVRRKRLEERSFAWQTYKMTFKDAFADSRTVVSPEELNRMSYSRLNEDMQSHPFLIRLHDDYYAYETPKIIDAIVHRNQEKVLGGAINEGLNKIDPRSKLNVQKAAAKELIGYGGFMQEALAKKPEFAEETLQKLGIDKRQDKISFYALGGYDYIVDENAKKDFAKFFDLKNRFNEMVDGPDGEKYFGVNKNGEICRAVGDYWEEDWRISEDISGEVEQRIGNATSELMERMKGDENLANAINEDRDRAYREEKDEIMRIFSGKTNENGLSYKLNEAGLMAELNEYLDKGALKCDRFKSASKYLGDNINAEKLGYLMDRVSMAKELGITEAIIDVDYPEIIREALTERLRNGVGKVKTYKEWWSGGYFHSHIGEETTYLADIFKTSAFLDNQERIGMDFADPEVKRAAFDGIINTLAKVRTTKDERKFAQAEWYAKTFFAEDFDTLRKQLKAYRESGPLDNWAKGQLGKFLKRSDFLASAEEEEKYEIISNTILREASKEDVDGLIQRRKEELREAQEKLITAIEEDGAEKIHTFGGPSPTGYKREEGGEKVGNGSMAPINFGVEKIENLRKYYNFLELNVPGANPHYFVDIFPGEEKENRDPNDRFGGVKLDSPYSYVGFTFEYEGKLCVVAESFNEDASMYLYCGELGSDYEMALFGGSKMMARANPNVANIRHDDRDNIGDSLDTTYQKAFMFFRTGDQRFAVYGDKKEWSKRQDEEFPAWPLGLIPDYKEHREDIARYRAWQAEQARAEQQQG